MLRPVDASASVVLYRGLFEGLGHFDAAKPVRTIPFFTLNYDLAVERACAGLGIPVVDGFDAGVVERQWTPSVYREYVEQEDSMTVVLVKLHGSVRLGSSGGRLIELPPGTFRDPKPYRHTLLYPSLGPKSLEQEPYRTNYSIFRSCLMHAELLVVIGSTLRDAELNALIRGRVEENANLYVLVVAPDADAADAAERIGCNQDRVGVRLVDSRSRSPRCLNAARDCCST